MPLTERGYLARISPAAAGGRNAPQGAALSGGVQAYMARPGLIGTRHAPHNGVLDPPRWLAAQKMRGRFDSGNKHPKPRHCAGFSLC